MGADFEALNQFDGTARLFPLPNMVLFPQVVQPLHIFEPRYRQMTKDALATDSLIAMALLRPGQENELDERPAIYPMACLGVIIADKMLDDGRYLLLLRGLSRIRIVNETKSASSYRSAQAEIVPDLLTISPLECRHVREQLGKLLLPRFTGDERERRHLLEMIDGETALGELCDMLSFRLPMPLAQKQELLEQPDVGVRAQVLLEVLESLPTPGVKRRQFPAKFSDN
jgi:Lon protease-like protein